MVKINRFIYNSDFASLSNDDEGVVSVTTPASMVLPPDQSTVIASQTITVGTKNSPLRCLMRSSAYPDSWVPCSSMQVDIIVENTGEGGEIIQFSLECTAMVRRISPAQLELIVVTPFLNNEGATVVGGVQTITAKIGTFLSPLD